MKLKQITLVVFSSVLAGCALLGPKYTEPQLNSPESWNTKDSNSQIQVESTNITDLEWWKKFNDPVLNHLIESALANNNNLQMAVGNLLQAQASLHRVEMNWVPTVSLGGFLFS